MYVIWREIFRRAKKLREESEGGERGGNSLTRNGDATTHTLTPTIA